MLHKLRRGYEGRKMRNKVVLLSIFLILIASSSIASAATITVNDDGGADYTSIQDAINNSSAGDFIEVWNGTYNENMDVNNRLTIYSRDGVDVTIVHAANSSDHVFEVIADYVDISGFTIIGGNAGIYLYCANFSNISNNTCSHNSHGIRLSLSNNNSISNNICSSNNNDGIYLLPKTDVVSRRV